MDVPNWFPNERVGIPDQRDATGLLALDEYLRRMKAWVLPSGRDTGQALEDARIITGFDWTEDLVGGPAGTVRTINRGIGFFPYFDTLKDNTLKHMLLFGAEGLDTIQVDFAGATSGKSQSVYVRFVYSTGEYENRVFWDPSGSPAQEYIDSIGTKAVAAWEVTYQDYDAAPPGNGEWVKIWEVTQTAGTITAAADFRHFFFEGSAHSTDDYSEEWGGGANDRNADRASYGVNDTHMVLQLIRRQLSNIIGDPTLTSQTHRHYTAPPIELSALNSEHYPESASGTQPGRHRWVKFGSTSTFHQLFAVDQDGWAIKGVDQSDVPQFGFDADDGTGVSILGIAPRGDVTDLTDGDQFSVGIGDRSGTYEFEERYRRVGTNERYKDIYINGVKMATFSDGSAVTVPGIHAVNGTMTSEAGFRISPPYDSDLLVVPLQYLADDAAAGTGWEYDQGGNVEDNATRLNTDAISVDCQVEIVLPHNAKINNIRVLWAQASTASGTEVRMYAQKHRIGQVSVGAVGGGTGSPSTFVNLKLTNNYIEHSIPGSTPHREVAQFNCNASDANRTFDAAQDKLVISFRSASAVRETSIYWLTVSYTVDWVSPKLP